MTTTLPLAVGPRMRAFDKASGGKAFVTGANVCAVEDVRAASYDSGAIAGIVLVNGVTIDVHGTAEEIARQLCATAFAPTDPSEQGSSAPRLLHTWPAWEATEDRCLLAVEVPTVGLSNIRIETAVRPPLEVLGKRFEVLIVMAGQQYAQLFHRTQHDKWVRGDRAPKWHSQLLDPQPSPGDGTGYVPLGLTVPVDDDVMAVQLGGPRGPGLPEPSKDETKTRPPVGYRFAITRVWGLP